MVKIDDGITIDDDHRRELAIWKPTFLFFPRRTIHGRLAFGSAYYRIMMLDEYKYYYKAARTGIQYANRRDMFEIALRNGSQ